MSKSRALRENTFDSLCPKMRHRNRPRQLPSPWNFCVCIDTSRTAYFSTFVGHALEERPRRSLMSVPGSDTGKISKAQNLDADAIVLDLEDGVAHDKKEIARDLVQQTLQDTSIEFGSGFSSSELCVRINGLQTTECEADLQAILPCQRLQSVVIPKVETAEDILFVSRKMDELCPTKTKDKVRIIAAIESALGILNLREIADTITASGSRLDALVFASEDYCADVEAIRTNDAKELLFARSLLVTTAKAYNLQAIDMVHIQFRDLEGLAAECQNGRELGFTGKQAIHPNQVNIINKHYSPSSHDVDFALRIVSAYEEVAVGNLNSGGKGSSAGACVVDGIVVDAPVYKWARKIIRRAEIAGALPP